MNGEELNRFIEHNLSNFSVNSTGWNDLIGKMLTELAAAGWNMDHDVFGKEKLGTLHCCMYSENEELNIALKKITGQYSELSQKVCEICGNEGKMRTVNSWQTTLCLNHFLEQKPVIEVDEDQNIIHGTKKLLNLKDIVQADVEFDLQQLSLYTKETVYSDEPFSFSWQEPNYYLLLKTVPLHLFPEDQQNNISELFQHLEYCEICGHKAVHRRSCLRCHHDTWTESEAEWYGDKSNYMKSCQLDVFTDEDDYEKYFKYDRSFEKSPDHQILFSHYDLREYEKRHF